ncbi:MAG: DUF998 domain-containing protein [Actinomycetota bacterium]
MRRFSARSAALGGIVGPVGFVAAWAIAGVLAEDSSPVDDAISRLAAVDASTRVLMTAGFVAFGLGVPLYAWALRASGSGHAWVTATIAGLTTLGVAVTPLDWSEPVDTIHGLLAGTGYIALALTPILASRPLRDAGKARAATASVAIGIVAGACLALTAVSDANGLFQRVGLTLCDVWIVASTRYVRQVGGV